MQAFDLGPAYYCILRDFITMFSSCLFMLVMFLSHQKIYIYLYYGPPFRGCFDKTICLSQLDLDIYCRLLPKEELPLYCPTCHDCFCDHAMGGLEEV